MICFCVCNARDDKLIAVTFLVLTANRLQIAGNRRCFWIVLSTNHSVVTLPWYLKIKSIKNDQTQGEKHATIFRCCFSISTTAEFPIFFLIRMTIITDDGWLIFSTLRYLYFPYLTINPCCWRSINI